MSPCISLFWVCEKYIIGPNENNIKRIDPRFHEHTCERENEKLLIYVIVQPRLVLLSVSK
jgi:hypothetical protein